MNQQADQSEARSELAALHYQQIFSYYDLLRVTNNDVHEGNLRRILKTGLTFRTPFLEYDDNDNSSEQT